MQTVTQTNRQRYKHAKRQTGKRQTDKDTNMQRDRQTKGKPTQIQRDTQAEGQSGRQTTYTQIARKGGGTLIKYNPLVRKQKEYTEI